MESFAKFDKLIDKRLLKSLADNSLIHPTLIQSEFIPLALSNKDILANAKTGSGKTLAYLLPIIQTIINYNTQQNNTSSTFVKSLILVPTNELSQQVQLQLTSLLTYLRNDISFINLSSNSGDNTKLQKVLLSDKPDLIISTPSNLLHLLKSSNPLINLSRLLNLCIDEADLILSYGHENDMKQLFNDNHLPKIYQTFLMSATLTQNVQNLKKVILRNPVTLKLHENEEDYKNLNQYFVNCNEFEKYLLIYVILKLKLIKGKILLFVNSVESGFKLRLFLEIFGIRSVVLNRELPFNSRFHIVQEFNKGVYDYIIATDEAGKFDNEDLDESESDDDIDVDEDEESDDENVDKEIDELLPSENEEDHNNNYKIDLPEMSEKKRKLKSKKAENKLKNEKKQKQKKKSEMDFGVARGVDFVDVACVINFDIPKNSSSYTHRIGRTARAGKSGISLSFVVEDEMKKKNDKKIFTKIRRKEEKKGGIKLWEFDWDQVNGFKYRVSDALKIVTPNSVKEARVKELKNEILNNDKLKVS